MISMLVCAGASVCVCVCVRACVCVRVHVRVCVRILSKDKTLHLVNNIVFRGCTSGGVCVPCIYTHAR